MADHVAMSDEYGREVHEEEHNPFYVDFVILERCMKDGSDYSRFIQDILNALNDVSPYDLRASIDPPVLQSILRAVASRSNGQSLWKEYANFWLCAFGDAASEDCMSPNVDYLFESLATQCTSVMERLDLRYAPEDTEQMQTDNEGIEGEERQVFKNAKHVSMFQSLSRFMTKVLFSDRVPANVFNRVGAIVCKSLVTQIRMYPRVAELQTLASAYLLRCQHTAFFESLPEEVEEHSAFLSELVELLYDIIRRLGGLKHQLQSSAVELVLAAGPQLLPFSQIQFALQRGLEYGLGSLKFANLSLSCIEVMLERNRPQVVACADEFLPNLRTYLASPAIPESEYGGSIYEIQIKVARILSSLGGHSIRLFNTQVTSHELLASKAYLQRWDRDEAFPDLSPILHADINFVEILPRVCELSERSTDEDTKTYACELLHALLVFMVGLRGGGEGNTNQASSFDRIFRRVFPAVLRLAAGGYELGRKLFRPLTKQVLSWYSRNQSNENEETRAILDCVLEGLQNADSGTTTETTDSDSALREFCAKCIRVFLERSLQVQSQDQVSPNVEYILTRLHVLAHHTSIKTRLGVLEAWKRIRPSFAANKVLVDRFLFRTMQDAIALVTFADTDPPAAETLEKSNLFVRRLETILSENIELLSRAEPLRVGPRKTIKQITLWLFDRMRTSDSNTRAQCILFCDAVLRGSVLLTSAAGAESWAQTEVLSLLKEVEERVRSAPKGHNAQQLEYAMDITYWLLTQNHLPFATISFGGESGGPTGHSQALQASQGSSGSSTPTLDMHEPALDITVAALRKVVEASRAQPQSNFGLQTFTLVTGLLKVIFEGLESVFESAAARTNAPLLTPKLIRSNDLASTSSTGSVSGMGFGRILRRFASGTQSDFDLPTQSQQSQSQYQDALDTISSPDLPCVSGAMVFKSLDFLSYILKHKPILRRYVPCDSLVLHPAFYHIIVIGLLDPQDAFGDAYVSPPDDVNRVRDVTTLNAVLKCLQRALHDSSVIYLQEASKYSEPPPHPALSVAKDIISHPASIYLLSNVAENFSRADLVWERHVIQGYRVLMGGLADTPLRDLISTVPKDHVDLLWSAILQRTITSPSQVALDVAELGGKLCSDIASSQGFVLPGVLQHSQEQRTQSPLPTTERVSPNSRVSPLSPHGVTFFGQSSAPPLARSVFSRPRSSSVSAFDETTPSSAASFSSTSPMIEAKDLRSSRASVGFASVVEEASSIRTRASSLFDTARSSTHYESQSVFFQTALSECTFEPGAPIELDRYTFLEERMSPINEMVPEMPRTPPLMPISPVSLEGGKRPSTPPRKLLDQGRRSPTHAPPARTPPRERSPVRSTRGRERSRSPVLGDTAMVTDLDLVADRINEFSNPADSVGVSHHDIPVATTPLYPQPPQPSAPQESVMMSLLFPRGPPRPGTPTRERERGRSPTPPPHGARMRPISQSPPPMRTEAEVLEHTRGAFSHTPPNEPSSQADSDMVDWVAGTSTVHFNIDPSVLHHTIFSQSAFGDSQGTLQTVESPPSTPPLHQDLMPLLATNTTLFHLYSAQKDLAEVVDEILLTDPTQPSSTPVSTSATPAQEQPTRRHRKTIRNYRFGELPDRQIAPKDLVGPLDALCKRDDVLAGLVLKQAHKNEKESRVLEQLESLLHDPEALPPILLAIWEVLTSTNVTTETRRRTLRVQLSAKTDLLERVCQLSIEHSFQEHVIGVLEQLVPRNAGMHSQVGAPASSPLLWVLLGRLYQSTGRYDTANFVFKDEARCKFTLSARLGLESALRENHVEATNHFSEVLHEADLRPGTVAPHEVKLCEREMLESLRKLSRWSELNVEMRSTLRGPSEAMDSEHRPEAIRSLIQHPDSKHALSLYLDCAVRNTTSSGMQSMMDFCKYLTASAPREGGLAQSVAPFMAFLTAVANSDSDQGWVEASKHLDSAFAGFVQQLCRVATRATQLKSVSLFALLECADLQDFVSFLERRVDLPKSPSEVLISVVPMTTPNHTFFNLTSLASGNSPLDVRPSGGNQMPTPPINRANTLTLLLPKENTSTLLVSSSEQMTQAVSKPAGPITTPLLKFLTRTLQAWRDRLPPSWIAHDPSKWDTFTFFRNTLLRSLDSLASSFGGPAIKDLIRETKVDLFLAAARCARKAGNLEYASRCLTQLSGQLLVTFDQAKEMAKLRIQQAKENGDSRLLKEAALLLRRGRFEGSTTAIKQHLLLGDVYQGLREMDDAHRSLLVAVDLADKLGPKSEKSRGLLARAHHKLGVFMDRKLRDLEAEDEAQRAALEQQDTPFGLTQEVKRMQEETRKARRAPIAEVVVQNLVQAITGGHANTPAFMPRLFHILREYPATRATFEAGSATIPTQVLLPWLPQIISHVKRLTADTNALKHLRPILENLSQAFPQSVYYATRATDLGKEFHAALPPSFVTAAKSPVLGLFVNALNDLINPEKRWQFRWMPYLAEVFPDTTGARPRAGNKALLQIRAEEVLKDFDPDRKGIGKWNQEYARKVQDAFRSMRLRPFANPDLRDAFTRGWITKSRDAQNIEHCNCFVPTNEYLARFYTRGRPREATADPKSAWRVDREYKYYCHFDNVGELSDFLGSFNHENRILVPGQRLAPGQADDKECVRIMGVDPKLTIFSSKQIPKKVNFYGNDGRTYSFIIKLGDDLRRDQRVMQCFEVANSVLANEPECLSRGLQVPVYAVVPLAPDFGLLECVDNTVSLASVLTRVSMQDETTISWNSFSARNGRDEAIRTAVNAWRAWDSEGLSDATVRTWLVGDAPSPQAFMSRRSTFAKTLAVFNTCAYVLGIGDRHDGNHLLSKNSGALIGIDFGYTFEDGLTLPFPELVPFRLTRQLWGGLAPFVPDPLSVYTTPGNNIYGGLAQYCEDGVFVRSMEQTVLALHKNSDRLTDIFGDFARDHATDLDLTFSNTMLTAEDRRKILERKLHLESPVDILYQTMAKRFEDKKKPADNPKKVDSAFIGTLNVVLQDRQGGIVPAYGRPLEEAIADLRTRLVVMGANVATDDQLFTFIRNSYGRTADPAIQDILAGFVADAKAAFLAAFRTRLQAPGSYRHAKEQEGVFASTVDPSVRAKAFVRSVVDLSTDPDLLARMFSGWKPYR